MVDQGNYENGNNETISRIQALATDECAMPIFFAIGAKSVVYKFLIIPRTANNNDSVHRSTVTVGWLVSNKVGAIKKKKNLQS